MTHRVIVLVFLAAASTAFAQDRVEIRPGVKAGSKITRTTDIEGAGTMSLDSGGVKKDFETTMATGETAAEEVLEVKAGRPVKLRRFYHRKLSTFKVPAADKEDRTDSSLTGRVLTVTSRDGKTACTCDDPNVDPKDLAREGLNDEWDFPLDSGKPVGAGDEWEPDAKLVRAWSEGRKRKLEEAKLKCRLAEFARAAGQRCARIEVELTSKGTTAASEKSPEQKIEWTLKGSVWFGLEAGRVVQFDLEGALEFEWDAAPPGRAAEHWTNTMKLKMKGTATPGEAEFEIKPDK
ncbi:MAG: hypothetical protein HYY18_16000 [Planctomycetes bacterium]|nr:hypothetical protein [Planctomycetota bacterium]